LSTLNLGPVESTLVREAVESSRLSILDVAERATGLLLLVVTMPVTAVSALAVAALSGRSPLVAHLRVGKNDKPFWMLKLRTMWNQRDRSLGEGHLQSPSLSAEKAGHGGNLLPTVAARKESLGADGATRGSRADQGVRSTFGWIEYVDAEPAKGGKRSCDPRVTSRFAAFCRRHSIDELPQLWHVFRGDMSLVGPRPLTRTELARHYGVHKAELLSVKPGLTGLWQVYGRSAIRFPQRSAMDLEMVRTLDRKMYLTIVLRTISALFNGKGAW
jgi:lipopolysaccharide/colanic/teichoic acid biosynthesis glycosyltransferase